MNTTTKTIVGVDTAKEVFQLHWVDSETGEVTSRSSERNFFSTLLIVAHALLGWKHAAAPITGPVS